MEEDLTRRRFRRDLEELAKQYPSLKNPGRLDRLKEELEAEQEDQRRDGDDTDQEGKRQAPQGC